MKAIKLAYQSSQTYNSQVKSFFIFVLFLSIGFFTIFVYQNYLPKKSAQNSPKKSTLSAKTSSNFSIVDAPSDALKGKLAILSDNIDWQSRTSTESSRLTSIREIQQGENLQTGLTGKALLEFGDVCKITIFPKTKIDVVQTLPATILIAQDLGKVQYEKIGDVPLSVHALDLLISQQNGTMIVTADKENKTVSITVDDGLTRAAFVDTQNETQIYTITKGQTLTFDDNVLEASVVSKL